MYKCSRRLGIHLTFRTSLFNVGVFNSWPTNGWFFERLLHSSMHEIDRIRDFTISSRRDAKERKQELMADESGLRGHEEGVATSRTSTIQHL